MATGIGHAIGRVLMSMWVHEIGHAVTAWLCGYFAFPGPWFTPTAESRGLFVPLVLATGFGALVYFGRKRRRNAWVALGVCGLFLQLLCTLLLKPDRAQALILFFGDGGCLVLGAALMATLYSPRGSALHRGWLRWGFLVIGAVAFADAFEQWWAARRDVDAIPFGENEGQGLSDPSKLQDVYGWSTNRLVTTYVTLGVLCLLALAALYLWGLVQARRALSARAADPSSVD